VQLRQIRNTIGRRSNADDWSGSLCNATRDMGWSPMSNIRTVFFDWQAGQRILDSELKDDVDEEKQAE
jgi:hypothetical protein